GDYGFNPGRLKNKWDAYMQALPEGACASTVFDNHDRYKRLSDEVGKNMRPLMLVQMALGGEGGCMRFVYYGDDIAMPSGPITEDTMDDPQGKNQGLKFCRDFSRTPMQWDTSLNAGFSVNPEAKPWLPVGDPADGNNVKDQSSDAASILSLQKNVIRLLKNEPALQKGRYIPYETFDEKSWVFERKAHEQTCLVLSNFSEEKKVMVLPQGRTRGEMIFSTQHGRRLDVVDGKVTLAPHEACVIDVERN
ncbi:MAG TPA: hypothetical protein V6C65_19990, partial [Allocoleopsis sp.]